ncbi:hypothetical protein [Conexibacter sp. S30A1]|uniref:hypothetical protein n=1 Tax=Conexibacter sp. S30A1 TaxID=2937800 RepID=UPI00200F7ED3|nr:hypothetical protein [Conexibacter sp. S30A1]
MSSAAEMPSVRRRLIPGMSAPVPTGISDAPYLDPKVSEPSTQVDATENEITPDSPRPARRPPRTRPQEGTRERLATVAGEEAARPPRRYPSSDYGSTNLFNFRLPVDLHDRFGALIDEVKHRHPRLRKPSLTELLIALLEEGPQTADGVAEMIRRKRLDEHQEGL